jgi:cell division protein FtsB
MIGGITMRTKKSNLTFSAVGFVASILIMLYLILNAPQMIQLIIVFGIIALADTYFLVDSIVKMVDELSSASMDKQTELVKVEKGIYSVAKREEASNKKQNEALVNELMQLKEENQRLNAELIEQQKLCTKILIKKSTENNNKMLNSSDRISKLLVQLNGNSSSTSKETMEILEEINKTLDTYYNDSNDNVRRMRAN